MKAFKETFKSYYNIMAKEGIRFHLPMNLTNEQINLIRIDLSDPKRKGRGENLIVKGYGGTGKTVVAYYRALSWQENRYKFYNGKSDRVLLLCYNKLLNSLLKSETDYPLKCDIFHLQRFYESIRNILEKKVKEEREIKYDNGIFTIGTFYKRSKEYYYLTYERNGIKTIENINEDSRSPRYFANNQSEDFLKILFNRYVEYFGRKIYKEIIIDEGQDISKNFLKNLNILADHIAIFADDHQKINEEGTSINEMKNIFCPNQSNLIEELTSMHRTTKEIFEYAVVTFLPDDEQAEAMRTIKTCRSDPNSEPTIKDWIQSDDGSRAENAVNLTKLYGIDNKSLNDDEKKELEDFEKKYDITKETKKTYSNILIICPGIEDIKNVSKILAKNEISHGAYFNTIDFDPSYLSAEQLKYLTTGIGRDQNILVTTYKSAKGLEAECVILYIPEKEYLNFINGNIGDRTDNIFYTLATRPKNKLLFVTNFLLSKYL